MLNFEMTPLGCHLNCNELETLGPGDGLLHCFTHLYLLCFCLPTVQGSSLYNSLIGRGNHWPLWERGSFV